MFEKKSYLLKIWSYFTVSYKTVACWFHGLFDIIASLLLHQG